MRTISLFLIVSGAATGMMGCRADTAPRSSSQFDQAASQAATDRTAQGTQPSVAAKVPPAGESDTRPLVVCFGDSLTAGYGADEGKSYPDFLQKDLDDAGYRYRVVNEGVSGNTTKDGVDRLSDIEAMKAAVVVLEFGGNDGLRGFKVQTTRSNLSHMIEGLQAAGEKVVLAGITLPPDYGPDYVNAFTSNYPVLGKKYNLPVLPFLLKDVYGVPGMMQGDNTHATNKGNEIVARNVLPLVEPLLKK